MEEMEDKQEGMSVESADQHAKDTVTGSRELEDDHPHCKDTPSRHTTDPTARSSPRYPVHCTCVAAFETHLFSTSLTHLRAAGVFWKTLADFVSSSNSAEQGKRKGKVCLCTQHCNSTRARGSGHLGLHVRRQDAGSWS